jgi:hypothetical protein
MTLNDAFIIIGTMRAELVARHHDRMTLNRNQRRVEALDTLMVMAQAGEIAAEKGPGALTSS